MSTQRQVTMESSLALGRLELNPCSAAVSVNLAQRISGGPPALEKYGQRAQGPHGQTHLNGCVPLSHQVAGHKYGVDKVGILQHPDGTVLKQLQPPPRGPRELQFYNMVYAEDCSNPCLLELQNHLPKYYGTWSSPDIPRDLYLKLEDVTRHFVKPCIMDVKLGQRSYDPYASQEKREQQIKKYPLMEEIGFLVLGMRVYKLCNDAFDIYDQHYGRGLVKDTIKDGLAKFFHNGVTLRKDAVSASICRVQQILQWFESQQQLTFYASSLLFVYEGLPAVSLSPPLLSPTEGKLAALSVLRDSNRDGEGKITQESTRQDENMEECNNNNSSVQMSTPWDYSLSSIYNHHIKDDLNHCPKANVHGTSGGIESLEVAVSSVSGDNHSVPCNEGKTCKRKGETRQPPNGNRNISQAETNNQEREEDKLKKVVGHPSEEQGAETDVEVRMIDFAHVFPSDSHDRGYIYGLKHLLSVLEQILCIPS